MSENRNVHIVVADPSALGLLGLAIVTLVASTQKLGVTNGTSFIVPWAIFLGAAAQLIAGALDFKHNNLFGSTVFSAFGLFWLGVAMSWMIKTGVFGAEMAKMADARQLGYAFLGYFLFALIGTVVAMEANFALFMDMVFIDLLLLSLAMDTLGFGGVWHSLAAWSELIISIISFYLCAANFINKSFNRVLVPVGSPLGIIKKGPAAGH